MFRSFLLITLRNIRGSGSMLPNILSLAVGMASCVLIYNYVVYEYSFDKFHLDLDDLIRLETIERNEVGQDTENAYTHFNLGELLIENEPAIQHLTRVAPFSENRDGFFRIQEEGKVLKRIYADKVFYTDESFFKVFSFELLKGDIDSALTRENSILLSSAHAQRVFGPGWMENDTIIGTQLKSGRENLNKEEFIITGIFAKPPPNSHLQFDALVSISSPKSGIQIKSNGQRTNLYTYVRLKEGAGLKSLEEYQFTNSEGFLTQVSQRKVGNIHSGKPIANQAELGADREMISFLMAIGVVILVMVWANYINSSLITSIHRIKEIGIRKLLGVKPLQLAFTFLAEALFINLLGAFIAIFLVVLSLKALDVFEYINYPTHFARAHFLRSLMFLLGLSFLSSLVSGLYPAVLMSKMQPVESLRGSLRVAQSKYSNKGSKVIRGLLIMQLGIVLIFVSAVYTVHRQLSYLENNNFSITELDVEGVFPGIIGADDDFNRRFVKLYNDMSEEGFITKMDLSNMYRGQLKNTYLVSPLAKPGMDSSEMYQEKFQLYTVDHTYLKDDSLAFVAGTNFSPFFSTDYGSVIVNESALKAIGYNDAEEAIGKFADDVNGLKIISGVIRNKTKEEPPMMFKTGLRFPTYFDIKVRIRGTSGSSIQGGLNRLERRLSMHFPYFYLLDEQFENMYKSEKEILNFFVSANIVALLIAGIGLYGLSSFTTLKRNQEIGVRKVLGANVFDILRILYYDFGLLMLYGALISFPLIIWGVSQWLSTYTYRIGLDVSLVLIPILGTALFILSTVSTQCWRSASKNPVLILKRN